MLATVAIQEYIIFNNIYHKKTSNIVLVALRTSKVRTEECGHIFLNSVELNVAKNVDRFGVLITNNNNNNNSIFTKTKTKAKK